MSPEPRCDELLAEPIKRLYGSQDDLSYVRAG
jgi:hypothetical protein